MKNEKMKISSENIDFDHRADDLWMGLGIDMRRGLRLKNRLSVELNNLGCQRTSKSIEYILNHEDLSDAEKVCCVYLLGRNEIPKQFNSRK